MGSVDGVARHCRDIGRELFVLWLDAHADFNTPDTSPSGNMHGMPLAALCGEPGLEGVFAGDVAGPRVSPDHVHLFGIRSVDRGERALLNRRGVDVVDMRHIDEWGVAVPLRRILDRVRAAGGWLHVSLDVDFLDPSLAPGVGTTVPGGRHLPRGSPHHGDDPRFRAHGLARRGGAQPVPGRSGPQRPDPGRPCSEPLRPPSDGPRHRGGARLLNPAAQPGPGTTAGPRHLDGSALTPWSALHEAIRLRSPGGLDNLQSVDMDDPKDPAAGEIRVRLHASSLNYHDYGVASRPGWQADGRIPMSDGAGVVEAVGPGVSAVSVGDHVASCFFPTWADGPAAIADFATVPGDGVDGFAREAVTLPATAFTRAPRGFSHGRSRHVDDGGA